MKRVIKKNFQASAHVLNVMVQVMLIFMHYPELILQSASELSKLTMNFSFKVPSLQCSQWESSRPAKAIQLSNECCSWTSFQ